MFAGFQVDGFLVERDWCSRFCLRQPERPPPMTYPLTLMDLGVADATVESISPSEGGFESWLE